MDRVLPEVVSDRYLVKFSLVLGIVIVAMAVAGGVFYIEIADQLQDGTQTDMETTAEDEAAELSQWVATNEQTARMISAYEEVRTGTAAEIESTFETELDELPAATAAIHYVDFESGTIEASSDAEATGTNIHELNLELHVREDGDITELDSDEASTSEFSTTYSDTYDRDGDGYIAFISPVLTDEGPTDQVVMVEVSATGVAEGFHNPIAGGYTQVVDTEDGDIMFAEDSDDILSEYRAGTDSAVIAAFADAHSGSFEQSDTEEVIGYAGVAGTDWVLIGHAPTANAYALSDQVLDTVLTLLGIVLLGFVLIGATVGRTTARSLQDLAEQAQTLSTGSLAVDTSAVDREDELGAVQESLGEIQSYLSVIEAQAEAIAQQEFEDPVLDQSVPGEIGAALDQMEGDLQHFVKELERAQTQAQQRSETLQSEAETISNTMAVAATGDFTERLDPTFETAAINDIARSYNDMVAELEQAIQAARDLATEVDRQSQEVQSGTMEIDQTSDEVSRAAEEISAATTEQTERFNDVFEEMNDLSATIEEIASTSQEVAAVSTQVDERATSASTEADAAIEDMEQLANRAETVTSRVDTLTAEINQVEELVDLIDEIAEQTNMLALNASVEAARVDDASGGFAVVADEIKTLAEETATATQEADTVIKNVREAADETAADVHRMQEDVTTGVDRVESTLVAIEEIAAQIKELNSSIQAIDDATDDQATASQEVVTMLDDATAQSEATDTQAEQVAVATEEQTSAIRQISTAAESLADQAESLRQTMERFDVNEATDQSDTQTESRT